MIRAYAVFILVLISGLIFSIAIDMVRIARALETLVDILKPK